MSLWKELSVEEQNEYRQWARENYKPMQDIVGVWHPVVQDECRKINEEWNKGEAYDKC